MATTLRTLLLGKPYDFQAIGRPSASRAQTLEQSIADLSPQRETAWGPLAFPHVVSLPRLAFTTNTLPATDCRPVGIGRVRFLEQPADGVWLAPGAGAGGVTVADCLAMVLWDDRRLAVLHGARACLVPPDGGPDILLRCLAEHGFAPPTTHAWLGAGIGPCCYGLNTVSSAIPALALRRPVRGPRADQRQSVDLRALAAERLRRSEVPDTAVTIDPRCTSCWDGTGSSPFWSHVRGDTERNLFLAWLE